MSYLRLAVQFKRDPKNNVTLYTGYCSYFSNMRSHGLEVEGWQCMTGDEITQQPHKTNTDSYVFFLNNTFLQPLYLIYLAGAFVLNSMHKDEAAI